MSTDDPQEQSVDEQASEPESADPRVATALRRAVELAETSPAEHVEIYEDVHRSLQEVLADASGQATPVSDLPAPAADPGDTVR
jgi:hypothetical protein